MYTQNTWLGFSDSSSKYALDMYLSFQVWLFSVYVESNPKYKQISQRSARYISNILELKGLCVGSFDPIKKQVWARKNSTTLNLLSQTSSIPRSGWTKKNTYNHHMLTKYTSIQVPTLKPT